VINLELPQIRLQSTFIKTGLTIEKPIQRVEQPKVIHNIEQPAAILEIETIPGKLSIDSTEARADVDLKSIGRRIKENADQGYQDWLNGMARRARQGRDLAQIHKGGNPIAAHAKENSTKGLGQYGIKWIPSHFSVKLQYDPAKVNINVESQRPIIDSEVQKPIHEYIPGDVTVNVIEENSLQVDFINLFPEKKE
jgi:hypothetical protein